MYALVFIIAFMLAVLISEKKKGRNPREDK